MNNDPAAIRARQAMEAGRQARIQEMTTRIQSVGRKMDAAVVAFNALERNPAGDVAHAAALAKAQSDVDAALRAVQALQVQADAFFAEDRAQHGRSRKRRRRRGTRRH